MDTLVFDPSFQVFVEEMELKDEAKRKKAKQQSAAKRLQRFSRQKQWRQQLKRTQRYLGLHITRDPAVGFPAAGEFDVSKLTNSGPVTGEGSGRSVDDDLESLSTSSENSIVFVCVDVEAFEFDQKIITEIGVSTLCTADLLGVQPGAKCMNWAAKIRSRHFRIQEHSHRVNRFHIEGCPEKFDFGESEWISRRNILLVLSQCFDPSQFPTSTGTCKVVLVGHNVVADIKYLKDAGFEVASLITDCIDTANLFRASNRDGSQNALDTLLLRYGIAAKNLHNAGNDAHFTLRLMMAVALDEHQNRKQALDWEVERQKRIEAACEIAKAKVLTDLEGWSTSEDDGIEGSFKLLSVIDQNQEKDTSASTKGQYNSNAKSTMNRRPSKEQNRPKYHSHFNDSQSDLALQDNPLFQDPTLRPYGPSDMAPAGEQFEKRDDRGDDVRGRGRAPSRGPSRGLGYNRGRGRGRGRGGGGNPQGSNRNSALSSQRGRFVS